MATTKEIIIDIEVDNRKAIPQIAEMVKNLEELKNERKDLKDEMKDEANQTQENYEKLATLDTQIRDLNGDIKDLNKAVDANIQKQEAQEGSLVQMRAELKNLVREYDNMSAAVRESADGLEKAQKIADLRQNLKDLEGNIGDFRRNVGDYRNAINDALNGNTNLKTALRELRTELQTVTFQQRQQYDEIQKQTAALNELANTVGKESQEYKDAEANLENMNRAYAESTQAINDMQRAAGNMQDTISDTGRSIKNFAADNAGLKATAEGFGLLADSYTVLKASMTALGIESEELMNVFAKLQIIQQGINSLNRIANALQKESVLRQQLRILQERLMGKAITDTARAKTQDAAASTAAAAADTTLAAGETAATAAAGGLTVALKTVGAAIKSIPVIGWVLAAVAVLGTVVGFIVKANKESKKGNDELERERKLRGEINDIQRESLENTEKQVVEMQQNVKHLKDLKEGTEEWDEMVTQVATDLGVDADWLKKNVDKVDELTQAWIKLQQSMALGEAAAKKMADARIKQATAEADIYRILSQTTPRKRVEELQKQLGMTQKTAENIAKAFNKFGGNSKQYKEALKGYTGQLESEINAYEKISDKAYEDTRKQQDEIASISEGHIATVAKKAHQAARSTQKDIKDLGEQLEDLLVEGMVDGVEKQIKQVELASQRWVAKMKEARDKDLKNKDLYDALILEKERQTQDKVKQIRQTEYARISGEVKKLTEAYNQLWNNSSSSSLGKLITGLDNVTNKLSDDINNLNLSIQELNISSAKMRMSDSFSVSVENLASQFDDDETKKQVEDYIVKVFKLEPEKAKEIASKLSEDIRNGFKNIKDEVFNIKIGADEESVLRFIRDFALQAKDNNILDSLLDVGSTRDIYEDLEKQTVEIQKQREEIEKNSANTYRKVVGEEQKALMIEREREKVNAEIAKEAQETALAQGEIGKLDEVPEDLSTYIDYKIEELQKERAILKDDINDAIKRNREAFKELGVKNPESKAITETEEEKDKEIKRLKEVEDELDNLYSKKRKISEQSLVESKDLTIEYGSSFFNTDQINHYKEAIKDVELEIENLKEEMKSSQKAIDDGILSEDEADKTKVRIKKLEADLEELQRKKDNLVKWSRLAEEGIGFFDNTEILKEEVEIEKLQNKINALNMIKQRGAEINDQIAKKEEELANLRGENSEENRKRIQDEINDLKTKLAEIGYTSEDEIDALINTYNGKIKLHTKTTEKLMAQTAASVLNSFSTVLSALNGLFNEIGEDNAEMANFLEGIAYAQIGVNLAVGIAEAVSAGAGQMFPYNLAAIAAGIAAVVSAIASAISTYKQYHKNVTAPAFASGGVIGGRTAKSKSEGRRDDVPIWASKGEYVINAEKVREYGVDFFDAINFGKKLRKLNTGRYADGGMVSQTTIQQVTTNTQSYDMLVSALEQMPAPVVAVSEINKVQQRVKVKEGIARNK